MYLNILNLRFQDHFRFYKPFRFIYFNQIKYLYPFGKGIIYFYKDLRVKLCYHHFQTKGIGHFDKVEILLLN